MSNVNCCTNRLDHLGIVAEICHEIEPSSRIDRAVRFYVTAQPFH